jgi:hypothetical protein
MNGCILALTHWFLLLSALLVSSYILFETRSFVSKRKPTKTQKTSPLSGESLECTPKPKTNPCLTDPIVSPSPPSPLLFMPATKSRR